MAGTDKHANKYYIVAYEAAAWGVRLLLRFIDQKLTEFDNHFIKFGNIYMANREQHIQFNVLILISCTGNNFKTTLVQIFIYI